MRTTIDIDDDVLQAARERARRSKESMGKVVSALARRGLTVPPDTPAIREPKALYGLRPFALRGAVVTNELIERLREDDAY